MENIEQLIIDTYASTKNVSRTAKIVGLGGNHHEVTRVLNKYKIERNGNRKYNFDKNFFDIINTEEKAYFLGFLWADGNNSGKGSISIKLSARDLHILQSFKSSISSERPIYHVKNITCKDKNNIVHSCSDAYCLVLNSKSFANKLLSIGLTPNKTRTLRMPNIIPVEFIRHFCRGVFDGDGCISKACPKWRRSPVFGVELSAKNFGFVNDFNRIIQEHLSISMSYRKCSSIYKMYLCGIRNQVKFLNWIYSESSIRLHRKYKRYLERKQYAEKYLNKRTCFNRGVSFKNGVYFVRKYIDGKIRYLGRFNSEQDAVAFLKQHGYATC